MESCHSAAVRSTTSCEAWPKRFCAPKLVFLVGFLAKATPFLLPRPPSPKQRLRREAAACCDCTEKHGSFKLPQSLYLKEGKRERVLGMTSTTKRQILSEAQQAQQPSLRSAEASAAARAAAWPRAGKEETKIPSQHRGPLTRRDLY